MKELENHLRLVYQMVKDGNSNFYFFLEKIKKKLNRLNRFPCGLLQKEEGKVRKKEKKP
jgi:uncharacterized protein YfkK (UPF0435 family)